MFKKKNRLRKEKDFAYLFKNGRSSFNKLTGIKIVKNNLNYNRYTVIVSKKTNKSAVKRNRLKRQVRSMLKNKEEHIKTGIDLAVIVLPGANEKDFPKLKESLHKNMLQLNISKDQ